MNVCTYCDILKKRETFIAHTCSIREIYNASHMFVRERAILHSIWCSFNVNTHSQTKFAIFFCFYFFLYIHNMCVYMNLCIYLFFFFSNISYVDTKFISFVVFFLLLFYFSSINIQFFLVFFIWNVTVKRQREDYDFFFFCWCTKRRRFNDNDDDDGKNNKNKNNAPKMSPPTWDFILSDYMYV